MSLGFVTDREHHPDSRHGQLAGGDEAKSTGGSGDDDDGPAGHGRQIRGGPFLLCHG
jgi:hypothetical protein